MKRRNDQGFALLFVFAMASIIAITLYVALPRITFEAQRDKEALLISRGEQYKRGIELYVRKFKRFPSKMEDLDNTNGIRFLRHHYKDPMTGKEEWRLIHAGPGGVLLDSLVTPAAKDKKQAAQTSITELLGVGGLPEADANANPALRKRPSDQQGAPGELPNGPAPGAPIPADPAPGTFPGQAPPNAANPYPANPFPGAFGQGPAGAGTGLPGRFPGPMPNPTNPPGSAVNSQTGGISASAPLGSNVAFPQGAGQIVPGQTPVPGGVMQQLNNPANPNGPNPNGQGGNDAARIIQGLLTTPRPGGLAGIQAIQAGNQTIGGGIAGVASTIKTGTGIKVYNDQDQYKKWEFVFDATKQAQGGAGGIPQQGRVPGTPVGTPPGQQPPVGAVGGGVFGPPPK